MSETQAVYRAAAEQLAVRDRLSRSLPAVKAFARAMNREVYLWEQDELPEVRLGRRPGAACFRVYPGGRVEWRLAVKSERASAARSGE